VDGSLGVLELSAFFSLFLFGILSLQTYQYFDKFREDRRLWKFTVAFVGTLELVHTAFLCHATYFLSVTDFGEGTAAFAKVPWSVKYSVLCSALVTAIVPTFFAFRVKTLSGRWDIPVFCWVMTVIRSGLHFAAFAFEISHQVQHEVFITFGGTKATVVGGLLLGIGVIVDTTIGISVSFYLRKNRSGIKSSDQVVNRLVRYTLETGMITSFLSILTLITFLTFKTNAGWFVCYVVLAKSYSNALMVSLNARIHLRNAIRDGRGHAGSMSGTNSFSKGPTQPIAIQMSTVTTTTRDPGPGFPLEFSIEKETDRDQDFDQRDSSSHRDDRTASFVDMA